MANNTKKENNHEILLAFEVAEYLKVEVGNKRSCDLYRLFDRWKIPYFKLGSSRRYRHCDVEAFINQSVQSPSECQSKKGKVHRSTGTTSRSKVVGLEEARKLIGLKSRNP